MNSKYIKKTSFILFDYEPLIHETLVKNINLGNFNKHIFNINVSIKEFRDIALDTMNNNNDLHYLNNRFEQVRFEHARHEINRKDFGYFVRDLLAALQECLTDIPKLNAFEFNQEWCFFLFHLINYSINPKLIGEQLHVST